MTRIKETPEIDELTRAPHIVRGFCVLGRFGRHGEKALKKINIVMALARFEFYATLI